MNIFSCRADFSVPAILADRLWITDHQFSGGVAERLIAPVLKTGRPKGLVSSNLTPSAIFDFEVLAQGQSITFVFASNISPRRQFERTRFSTAPLRSAARSISPLRRS